MMNSRAAFTVDEVSELLGGVSRRTVYNWINRHGLKVTKVGSRPMILAEDLEAFRVRNRQPEVAC